MGTLRNCCSSDGGGFGGSGDFDDFDGFGDFDGFDDFADFDYDDNDQPVLDTCGYCDCFYC